MWLVISVTDVKHLSNKNDLGYRFLKFPFLCNLIMAITGTAFEKNIVTLCYLGGV